MHRTFWGAKRSTGARLEQKLVQLTSPGHAPTASLGCSFFLLPSPTPAISHPEREPDFSFTTKGSRSPDDEKKTSDLMPMIVELARSTCFLDTIVPEMALGRTSDDLGTSYAYIDMFLYGRDELPLFWVFLVPC